MLFSEQEAGGVSSSGSYLFVEKSRVSTGGENL